MAVKIDKQTHAYLIDSIRRFFADELDSEIGELKAARVLDFCLREIAPSAYNQAIVDAQAYFQQKAADLGGARYEVEFGFWKK